MYEFRGLKATHVIKDTLKPCKGKGPRFFIAHCIRSQRNLILDRKKLRKIYVHTATADPIRGKKFSIFDSPNPVEYLSIKIVLKSQIKR